MYKLTTLLAFLLTFFAINALIAQENRFGAGVVVGVNASQITGDKTGGYNKIGIQAGLRGVAFISEKFDLSTELLFSQRGSRSEKNNPRFAFGAGVIQLNYIEVPVLANYKDWLDPEGEYYKINFLAGLSYGRLISASTNRESSHTGEEDNFAKNDISFMAGVTFYATKNIGITGRFTRSINLLYDNRDEGNQSGFNSLRGYLITLQGVYMF